MRRSAAIGGALVTVGVLGIATVAVAAPAGYGGAAAWGPSGTCDGSGQRMASSAGPGAGLAGAGRGGGAWGGGAAGRGPGGGGMGRGGGASATPRIPAAVPGATISSDVSKELVFMAQEEQLARDVYSLAAGKYPDRVFANIARAESTHLAAVRALLARYDVDDPSADAEPGQFADTRLQALYDKLAAQVATSRDAAVQAGITVERTDIADLQEALDLSAPADVDTVLRNLMTASGRHLAAFQRNA